MQSKDQMADISKMIFGGEKTFDFDELRSPEKEDNQEESEVRQPSTEKDFKKKEALKKFLLHQDNNLNARVNKHK